MVALRIGYKEEIGREVMMTNVQCCRILPRDEVPC
jgi:hypothetical protein